jgi:hypothetical protein
VRAIIFLVGCFAASSVSVSDAAVEIIDSRTESYSGAGISAVFKIENYTINVEKIDHYGTRMAIQYRTPSVADLEKFAVVQFFRGCQFGSSSERKSLNISRRLFGEMVIFRAMQWLVDSVDVDPMYNSPEESALPRHYYYRWSKNSDLFSSANQNFFGELAPVIPALHMTDRPGQAWHDPQSGVADNISLEMKTCLVRTEQLPRVSAPEKTEFGEPIHCFPWRSSFVFDHEEKRMKMPSAIDPFCYAQQPAL